MFIGHFALGFAAKKAAPAVSLAWLFVAAQFADLLWPTLVALGVERVAIEPGITRVTPLNFISYPYSHSLVMLLVWGIGLALVYRQMSADVTGAFMLAALVVSHWILDVVTHRPDMPLYPGSARFGLGLWQSIAATIMVELALFAGGIWLYVRETRPRDGVGRWSLTAMVVSLIGIYFANLSAGAPPSVTAIWVSGLIGAVLVIAWSAWLDRHRQARSR